MREASPAAALWFLLRRSWKNRLLSAIRRLRQPKYLAGLLVALAYFAFLFSHTLFTDPPGRRPPGLPAGEILVQVGSVLMLAFAAFAWIGPSRGPALLFSPAEIDFLFPAPLRRRTLIRYAILKAQIPVLVSSVLIAFFSRGMLTGHAWLFAAGLWLAFSVMQLHATAVSQARELLKERGWGTAARAGLAGGILAVFATAVWLQVRAATAGPGGPEGTQVLGLVLGAGPVSWLLFPFRAILRPAFAESLSGFLAAAPWALGIGLLHYLWILRTDVAFEEASIESSERIARILEGRRRGGVLRAGRLPKPGKRRPPFPLAPSGFPPTALFWKNLITAGRLYAPRNLAIALVAASAAGVAMAAAPAPFARVGGALAAMGAAVSVAMTLAGGPRVDLRTSLLDAALLKTLPLPGWKIVLGETLASAILASSWLWVTLAYGAAFLGAHSDAGISALEAACLYAAAVALAFPLCALSTLVQNGAALLFPGWGLLGRMPQRGIAAMGQRILMFAVMSGILAAALVPAAVLFLLSGGILRAVTGRFLLWTPVSAGLAALPLLAESAAILYLLGKTFERFDPSRELETP